MKLIQLSLSVSVTDNLSKGSLVTDINKSHLIHAVQASNNKFGDNITLPEISTREYLCNNSVRWNSFHGSDCGS